MDEIGEVLMGEHDAEVKIPDLDWMLLPKDNIPTENNVESIPQLEEQWMLNKENTIHYIPNINAYDVVGSNSRFKEAKEDIISYTKKLMTKGLVGDELSNILSSLYTLDEIKNAEDKLKELADEQGLLGKVYIDMSIFDSCEDALNNIGFDKLKIVKYVIGKPIKKCCRGHANGFCTVLGKKVVDNIKYDKDLLDHYTKYLRIIGNLDEDEKIRDKDDLRKVLLRVKKPTEKKEKEKESKAKDVEIDIDEMKDIFRKQVEKKAKDEEREKEVERFLQIRPVLAYVQNLMLKGKTGEDLKECIKNKYSEETLKNCVEELNRIISLQGLLGNVYVDISLYNTSDEAIDAIKNAETSPLFVIQTRKNNDYDDSLERVCKATGCSVLPEDGSVDPNIVLSYLQDLLYSGKISKDVYKDLASKVERKHNILVIKEAFDKVDKKKIDIPKGGVKGYSIEAVRDNLSKDDTFEKNMSKCINEAFEKGIEIDRIIDKTASLIGSTKSKNIVYDVLYNREKVSADCLSKCDEQEYDLNSKNIMIVKTNKCGSCIYNSSINCLKQNVNFVGEKESFEYFAFDNEELKKKINSTIENKI